MKMARIILTTLFLSNLLLVPSIAFPFREGGEGGLLGLQNGNFLGFPFPFRPIQDQDRPKNEQQEKPEEVQKPQEFQDQPNTINPNLREGFYSDSCPNAEKIIADAFAEIVRTNPKAMANILRLQFHDCFVVGCDASILLDSTPNGDNVEKSSFFNGILLKGPDLVDDIKSKLEEECPGIVSCADTMVFLSFEAMALAGMPRQKPLGGRRDSLYSLATVVDDNNLPMPNWSADKIVELFQRKGFSPEEMVILLGAHSIGAAHCDIFMDRVYNFKNTNKPDPALRPPFLNELRQICSNPGTPRYRNEPVNFDNTPTVMDNLFYRDLVDKGKSLLLTDAHLVTDPRTAPTVGQMADDQALFHKRFAEVVTKLTSLNVLTGNDGEVRKICRATN